MISDNIAKGECLMTISVLLAILVLLGLALIFGITFFAKGWKFAFIVTGAALVVSVIFYLAAISIIASAMG